MGARALPWQRHSGIGVRRGQLVSHAAALDLLLVANTSLRRGVHAGLCEPFWRRWQTEQARGVYRADRRGRAKARRAPAGPASLLGAFAAAPAVSVAVRHREFGQS